MKNKGSRNRIFSRSAFISLQTVFANGLFAVGRSAVALVLLASMLLPNVSPVAVAIAEAAMNKQINYQGKLTNSANVAVADGQYAVTFRLYTQASGGTPIWTEVHSTSSTPVTVTNGLFSTMLGSIASLASIDFNQALYLGVEIESDGEMSPRKVIGAVPAALEADKIDGIDSTQLVRTDATSTIATSSSDTVLTINQAGSGNILELQSDGSAVFTVLNNGNVGVGTSSPYAKLSVAGAGAFDGLVRGSYFIADSNASSVFPYASTTALTVAGNSYLGTVSSGVWNGSTIGISYGGTGTSTAPTYGQLLIGNAAGGYDLVSTSTLGLLAESIISNMSDNYLAKWNGSAFVDSQIEDDGTDVTIADALHIKSIGGETWEAKDSSRSWFEVAMSADGSYQVATVPNDEIYVSSDYGETWETKDTSRSWRGVAISADGSRQTAVAYNGQIYVSADYGETWTAKDSSRPWYTVAMSSDGQYQTAGTLNGRIYVSSDYGETWTAKDSSRVWVEVAMSADGSRQTAVVNNGRIYVSSDYGETWTAKDSSRYWFGVAMSSDGQYQTATAPHNAGLNGRIYVSSDYGETWTAKDSIRGWNDVAMSADGSLQTATVSSDQIYVSTDYGETWTGKDGSRTWSGVAMSADGLRRTAIVSGGQIYVSRNNVRIGINKAVPTTALDIYGTASSTGLVVNGTSSLGTTTVAGTLTLSNDSVLTGDTNYLRSNRGLAFGSTETYNVNSSGVGSLAGLTVSTSTSITSLTGSVSQVSTSASSSPRSIAVCGNYGYAVNQGQNTLAIIDLSDKSNPTILAATSTDGTSTYGVACSGGYAYTAGLSGRFNIFDVSDPSLPLKRANLAIPLTGQDIVVDGNYAYVSGSGLTVIDITTKTAPSIVGTMSSAQTTACRGLAKSGDYVYLACENGQFRDHGTGEDSDADIDGTLSVIDVSTPSSPSSVAVMTGSPEIGDARDVAIIGDDAYVTSITGYLNVFDVSDPSNPATTTSFALGSPVNTEGQDNTPGSIYAIDNNYGEYVAVQNLMLDKTQIIDVSTPSDPSVVRDISLGDQAWGIYVDSGYLYLTASNQSTSGTFYVYDLDSIFSPTVATIVGRSLLRDILPDTNGIYSIGSSAYQFLNGYVKNLYSTNVTTTNLTASYASTTALTVSGTLYTTGIASSTDLVVSSMTSGSVPFIGPNGQFMQDNSNFYWDTLNNRLGLGTSSPAWNLQIAGTRPYLALSDINAGTDLKHWTMSSQGGNLYFAAATDALATGTPALTISSNGYVGIGESDPNSALDVVGSASVSAVVSAGWFQGGRLDLTARGSASSPIVQYVGDTNTGLFFPEDDTIAFTASGTERFRISPDGNLGIGTTSPYARLSVVGQAVAEYFTATSTSRASTFPYASTTALTVSGTADIGRLNVGDTSATAGAVTLRPGNASNLFHLDNTSGTGIRMSSGATPGTSQLFSFQPNNYIYGDTTTPFIRLSASNGTSIGWSTNYFFAGGSGLDFYTSGSQVGRFHTNGNFGVGTTTPWGKISITNTGAGPSFVVEDSTSPDATPFIIDASGNVGIGTSSPSAVLSVVGSQMITGGITVTGTSQTSNFGPNGVLRTRFINGQASGTTADDALFLNYATNQDVYIGNTGGNLYVARGNIYASSTSLASAPSHSFYNDSNTGMFARLADTLGFSTGGTERLTITSAGNVGIGTTTPLTRLGVKGTAGMPVSSGTTPNGILTLGAGANNLYMGTYDAYPWGAWLQVADERFLETTYPLALNPNGGNVGVGTTSPYARLSVTNTGAGPSFVVEDSTSPDATPFIIDAAGTVGMGTTRSSLNYVVSPISPRLFVDSTDAVTAVFSNSTAGSTGGGSVLAYSLTGSATANGDRLGSYFMGGALTSGSDPTTYHPTGIAAFADGAWSLTSGPAYMSFYTTPSGSVTRQERIRIASGGNVGIGTTSPSQALSVSGNTYTSGSLNVGTTGNFGGNVTSSGYFTYAGNAYNEFRVVNDSSSGYFTFDGYMDRLYFIPRGGVSADSGITFRDSFEVDQIYFNFSGETLAHFRGGVSIAGDSDTTDEPADVFTVVGGTAAEDTSSAEGYTGPAISMYAGHGGMQWGGGSGGTGGSISLVAGNGGDSGSLGSGGNGGSVVISGGTGGTGNLGDGFRGSVSINANGGNVSIGNSSSLNTVSGTVYMPNLPYAAVPGTGVYAMGWDSGNSGMLTQSSAADIVEKINSTQDLEDGEVVMADSDNDEMVVRTEQAYEAKVIGVVTKRPGLIIGGKGNQNLVLAGRIKVKVSGENGAIMRGDPITTADFPGHGMLATESDAGVYAVALERFEPENASSTGMILAIVRTGTTVNPAPEAKLSKYIQDGAIKLGSVWGVDHSNGDILPFTALDLEGVSLKNVKAISGIADAWSIDENGHLIVKEITTEKLLVEQGVTTKDRQTGEYVCMFVDGGSVVTVSGRCEDVSHDAQEEITDTVNPVDDPSPVVEEGGQEESVHSSSPTDEETEVVVPEQENRSAVDAQPVDEFTEPNDEVEKEVSEAVVELPAQEAEIEEGS